jgi:N,N-dimethylformamidase beta subunit-like protein
MNYRDRLRIEYQSPGTSAWQLTAAARNHEVEGYASLTSVNAGEPIGLLVNSTDPQYSLTIYRMGYYGGRGGRQMTSPVTLTGIRQPVPSPDPATGIVDCPWSDPYVFTVPADWVSGVYLAKLTGLGSGKQSYIIFVVRNDGCFSDLLFQSSVTTYQAYNTWGGKSLYRHRSTANQAAVKVSFNRPYRDSNGAGHFFKWEFDMLGFLEREGYEVTYATDIDTHENPAGLLLHNGFLSVGHDEYWSWEMRQNIERARDQGVSLGFFGANACYWQIRLEPSLITGAPARTIVCYKFFWRQDPAAGDASTHQLVTTRWRDPHASRPGDPEEALIGVMYNERQPVDADILIDDPSSWVFANSGLERGDLLRGLVGYEADRMYDSAPPATLRLTHSPYRFTAASADGTRLARWIGAIAGAASATTEYSDMSVYQASSGAIVFATGTVQWSWGLGHLSPESPRPPRVNPAAQQITRNVLARFNRRS